MSMLDVARPRVPQYTEPLPRYSRHEPDATSVRSAAPSYESDRPAYDPQQTPTSLLPPLRANELEEQRPTGLPSPLFAPGFENRANSAFYEQTFDLANLNNMRTSNNARQFQNIARRRAKQDRQTMTMEMLNSLSSVPLPRTNTPRTPTAFNSATAPQPPISVFPSSPIPQSPANLLEDPNLVGTEAAKQARSEREHREMTARREQTMQLEDRSWDFMMSQMTDWEEREKNWSVFRNRVEDRRAKGFRRRWGLKRGP
ncbi:hypothetical protein BKA66DRAFT_571396 [Pyrenochaeta sp. MPI-SDFR-AT-0127]|nr:hypothetical protein BKA66DRAFT_571396 [Pyrenochaeta sp. MPI-SDFR-AT-0127]